MIVTDIKKETKALMKSEGLTWEEVGRRCGMTRQGAYSAVCCTKIFIPNSLVELLELLGYDIEIEYVRRNKE